jgi:hypothetical protein
MLVCNAQTPYLSLDNILQPIVDSWQRNEINTAQGLDGELDQWIINETNSNYGGIGEDGVELEVATKLYSTTHETR